MNEASSITLKVMHGVAIAEHLDDIARLRIDVFREWPYLYQGDVDYEANYLGIYTQSPRSIAVLALDEGHVVGASTGLPMEDETEAFRSPLMAAGIDPLSVFYCGESVLLPEYRGRGIGHAFFDVREAHARSLGDFDWSAFAAIDRSLNDPRRPPRHRDNDVFWMKRGYRRSDITMQLPWNEAGHGETEHSLSFWLRPLEETE